VAAEADRALERDWWLRALLVLQRPTPVFAAMRDDSDEAAAARQEPILAILLLAGISGVLSTSVAGRLLDDAAFAPVAVPIWAFVGGLVYGLGAYFAAGGLLLLGASLAGSLGTYRRARHVVAFAAAPLALSLLVWPVRVAVHGSDLFRRGGSDTGVLDAAFELALLAALAWAAVLLVVGVRAVHGWTWPRALAASVPPLALPAAALARGLGLV
jgi:hypothetical protein